MHELYELKEKLMKELEEYGRKGDLSAGTLDVVDKLAHTVKNLCKIIEDAEYSSMGGSYESNYARGGSYANNGGRGGRGGGYSNNMGGMQGGSFARGDGRGRGSNANRDSMGRYSSGSAFADELRELMEDAPDERTRNELERLANKMEHM